MSKILITGGAGFIGYFIANKLSENLENHITIVDNLLRGRIDEEFQNLIKKENVTFINGDLTDPRIFFDLDHDYDYIYHLAAIIGVKNVMNNPDKVLSVNTVSTLNIFQFAKTITNLKRILFSSTSEVYTGTLKHYGIDIPTSENVNLTIDDISSNRTTYALSKIFGESVCFTFGQKYNIPFTIVRYHNIYGQRMGFAHVIPELFIKIKENDKIDLPSPTHSRAFCYIDDAVEMTIKSCESENTKGEILNIGNSDSEIKMYDLVKIISQVMGKKVTINKLPDTPGSPTRRCPDTTKINNLLKLDIKTNLYDGIKKTFEWYSDKLDKRYE